MVGEVTETARVQTVKGNVDPDKDFEFYSQCDGKPFENSDERLLLGQTAGCLQEASGEAHVMDAEDYCQDKLVRTTFCIVF